MQDSSKAEGSNDLLTSLYLLGEEKLPRKEKSGRVCGLASNPPEIFSGHSRSFRNSFGGRRCCLIREYSSDSIGNDSVCLGSAVQLFLAGQSQQKLRPPGQFSRRARAPKDDATILAVTGEVVETLVLVGLFVGGVNIGFLAGRIFERNDYWRKNNGT